jgi:hypothetical protein
MGRIMMGGLIVHFSVAVLRAKSTRPPLSSSMQLLLMFSSVLTAPPYPFRAAMAGEEGAA